MARCQNIRFVLISPEELRVPDYIINDVLEANGIEYKGDLQPGRGHAGTGHPVHDPCAEGALLQRRGYIRLKNSYVLTKEKMGLAKPDMAVLHPLPRVNEIALDGR